MPERAWSKRARDLRRLGCIALLLGAGLALGPTVRADLLAPGAWQLAVPHPGDAALETVPGDATSGHGEGLRVTVRVPSDPVWLVQIARGIPADVPAGHVVQLHFWGRSASANPVRVTIEQPAAPYQGVVGETITLSPQWTEYTLRGTTTGYGPNGLSTHFQAGAKAGVVELAGVTVVDAGVESIPAAIQAALQPDQIQARIEKYRKGDLTIQVVDAAGRPVEGAAVQITQTRHAFLFGCNLFALNPADPSPPQQAYQAAFAALFNYATLPFYWGAFEPVQGHPDDARLEAMARWGAAHGLALKGHPLIYHLVWPSWGPATPEAAIPLLQARVTDLIPHFQETIHYWDVLNEANSAADFSPANGESLWIRQDGPARVVETALGWARAARPPQVAETFLYNDFETSEVNVNMLKQLQAAGQLPDAIGIQSHMHNGTWSMAKIWQTCETFAPFGRPIHFTETTVLSGPKRLHRWTDADATDWNTTPEDEAKQADYVPQFYTLLFSHPNVRAITWWDFSDKNAWMGAPGGLLRKDMSPKPAYMRLMGLIHHDWWTRTSGTSNGSGLLTRRVFYGDYEVTVTSPDGKSQTQTVTFPEAAPPLAVTVHLP